MLNTLVPPALPLALSAFAARSLWSLRATGARSRASATRISVSPRAGGESAVFKVCHPAEGEDILQCQAMALEHIALADPALPVPRLIGARRRAPAAHHA